MSKANEPAYPQGGILNATHPGLTKREKLAKRSLRAADIFFEQLNK